MKLIWYTILIVSCTSLTGCVIIDVGVTNPNPEISSVAVAPFFNQSAEKAADGRRIALAYATELQKIPGYQVVPVGVSEIAIAQHQLQMSRPADVLKLATLLNVDAVVVGSVTDYDPYYPPRIGLHVEWYSPYPVQFQPGIAIDPDARKHVGDSIRYADPDPEYHRKRRWVVSKIPLILRGQSPDTVDDRTTQVEQLKVVQKKLQLLREKYNTQSAAETTDDTTAPVSTEEFPSASTQLMPRRFVQRMGLEYKEARERMLSEDIRPKKVQESAKEATNNILNLPLIQQMQNRLASRNPQPADNSEELDSAEPPPITHSQFTELTSERTIRYDNGPLLLMHSTPLRPFMSYTRMFDGSDAEFTAALRNHLELKGDIRSGGWESSLQRSEDFIRFTSYLMISEMLMLHGGEARRRIVIKHRKYK